MSREIEGTTFTVATGGQRGLELLVEAFRIRGAVLLFREVEHLAEAINLGIRPDLVVVALQFGPQRLSRLLHQMFENTDTRDIPVLGASDESALLYQIAPRAKQRAIPVPVTERAARDLVAALTGRQVDEIDRRTKHNQHRRSRT